jgi:hypothetical protein
VPGILAPEWLEPPGGRRVPAEPLVTEGGRDARP